MSADEVAPSSPSTSVQPAFDRHRALVRETDKSFSQIYGFGGAAVLLCGAAVVIVAWVLGILWHVATFVVAITVVLLGLFVLRTVVNKKRNALRAAVLSYCELNQLDVDALRADARDEGIYPYFEALFESRSP